MRFSKELTTAKKAAEKAGKIILDNYGNVSFEIKDDNSFVSKADKDSQSIIKSTLEKKFPEYGFIGEEDYPTSKASDYSWVVDPLDGTTNYKMLNPLFNVSIGLIYKKNPIMGVVFNPVSKEMFYAEQWKGCYLNETAVNASKTPNIKKSAIAFAHGASRYWTKKYLDIYDRVKMQCKHSRQFGATALELAYVACGRLDGYMICGLKPWDVAAGSVLVKEAGGRVTDFNHNEFMISSKTLLATNGLIHNKFLSLMHGRKINAIPGKVLARQQLP